MVVASPVKKRMEMLHKEPGAGFEENESHGGASCWPPACSPVPGSSRRPADWYGGGGSSGDDN